MAFTRSLLSTAAVFLGLLSAAATAGATQAPGFSSPAIYAPPQGYAWSLIDFDGDGVMDLAAADWDSLRVYRGLGTGLFELLSVSPVGHPLPRFAAAGDLTGDGFADLVVYGTPSLFGGTRQMLIYAGDGEGGFALLGVHAISAEPTQIDVVRLDGDVFAEVVYAIGDGLHAIRTTNGVTFQDVTIAPLPFHLATDFLFAPIEAGQPPSWIAWATHGGRLAISAPDGSGGFGTPVVDTTLTGVVDVVARDLNGDGVAELIIAGSGAGPILEVTSRGGSGTWSSVGAGSVEFLSFTDLGVACEDFDGDGIADVVIGAQYDITSSGKPGGLFFKGNGGFDFGPAQNLGLNYQAGQVRSADFNGDGHADLIGGTDEALATLMLARGASPPFGTVRTETRPLRLPAQKGDLDGDGLDELVFGGDDIVIGFRNPAGEIAVWDSLDVPGYLYGFHVTHAQPGIDSDLDVLAFSSAGVTTFLGDGAGGFAAVHDASSPTNVYAAVVGDFDADGWTDLIYTTSTELRLLRSDGAGQFMDTHVWSGTPYVWTFATGDFDEDGWTDLVIDRGSTSPLILGGFPNATFAEMGWLPTAPEYFGGIATLDANGDSHRDIVLSTSTGYMVCLGDGDGGFSCSRSNISSASPLLWVDDADGDGRDDLLMVARPAAISVALQREAGGFEPPIHYAGVPYNTSSALALDVNGDGIRDLVATVEGAWFVFEGLASGTVAVPPVSLSTAGTRLRVHPTPLSSGATLEFDLDQPGSAALRLYDLSGRRVGTGAWPALPAGSHRLQLPDGVVPSGVRPGVYFLELSAAGRTRVARVVVAK